MDELTRFARQLVERLTARPEGTSRPVSVAEIRKTVLPYRAQRRALGLESVEDYDTVLLRLVAEERGYVKTMPANLAARCREELTQPNPDLGILDDLADATIQVTSLAAGRIVSHEEDAMPAPSRPVPPAPPPPPPPPSPPPPPAPPAAIPSAVCRQCQAPVPRGRKAVFCHQCGTRLIPVTCTRCGEELEPGWKHCIVCATPVPDSAFTLNLPPRR